MSQSQPTVVKCPTCKTDVVWGEQSPYRPFCCKRCQLIDLGEWAKSGIPIEPPHLHFCILRSPVKIYLSACLAAYPDDQVADPSPQWLPPVSAPNDCRTRMIINATATDVAWIPRDSIGQLPDVLMITERDVRLSQCLQSLADIPHI